MSWAPPPEIASTSADPHCEPLWVRGTHVAAGCKGPQNMMASVRLIPRAPPLRNQLQRPSHPRRFHGYNTQLKTHLDLQTCTYGTSKETPEAEQLFMGASTAGITAAPLVSGETEERTTSGQKPEEEEVLAEGGFACPTEPLCLGW